MNRLLSIAVLTSSVLFATGCAELMGMVAPETTPKGREEAGMKRVEEAKASGDIAALEAIIKDDKQESSVKSAARDAKNHIKFDKLIGADCADLDKHFDKDFSIDGDQDEAVGRKLATCNAWDMLFENARRLGNETLIAVEKDGVKLADKLVEHLDGQGRFKNVDDAIEVTKWLVATKEDKKATCAAVDQRMANIDEESVGEFLWFFYETDCASEALPHAEKRLAQDKHNMRIQACDIIGKFGDDTYVEKLEALAETDPHVVVRERNGYAFKEYDVRDRCKAAIGKIKLRK